MRIVLQQKETQLYFADIDTWTPSSKEAMDFGSSTKAIDFCLQNNFKDVLIVLKFDDQKYDIVLETLTDAQKRPEPRPAKEL